ncbi:MAG: Methyltransferase type 11 [Proteobacteria bacterium]|nr:Methyltransferase type 11 [Pseudomonadota bacterium]
MKELVCNICSDPDYEVLFEAGEAQIHRIVKCAHCGLIYANPQEIAASNKNRSSNAGNHSEDSHVLYDRTLHLKQRAEKERIQVADYISTRKQLNALHPLRGKLLEIGSGFGNSLHAFRSDGWDVRGVDPDSSLNCYARDKFGLQIDDGYFASGAYSESSFDVVIMNHVIEHLPDPKEVLLGVHRILAPNGHLLIETPRYDSITFKLLGKRERSLSCFGHIYFFTGDSLRHLCEVAGYKVVKHTSTGRTLTIGRLLWNIGVISKRSGTQRAIERLSVALNLDSFRLYLNVGDIQRICLAKA